MSSLKDLFVSIKVKSTGVDKLQQLNRTMRTTLALMKEYNRVVKGSSITEKAEKTLVQTEQKQRNASDSTGKKDGFFVKAPNILAVVMLTRKLTDLISKIGQLSYELLKLSRNFGVSTTALQNFGYEAVANGVKMEDFNSAIATLKKNSADIMLGRGNISPYALLGLNPHEDPEKLLVSLQRRLRELPESIGTAFASDLGLSMDMINYVRKADFGRTGSRAILSSKELGTLERARNLVLDLKNNFLVLAQKVGVALAPIVEGIFGRLNSLILDISFNTDKLRDVLFVIAGTLATIFAKSHPILALIMGIGLILEDLVKTGGEGIMIWIDVIMKRIYLAFNTLVEWLREPLTEIINLFGITEKIMTLVMKFQESKFGKWLTEGASHSNLNYSTNPQIMEAILEAQRKQNETKVNITGSIGIKNEEGKTIGTGEIGSGLNAQIERDSSDLNGEVAQ